MSTVCPWSNGPLRPRTFILLLVLMVLLKFGLAWLLAADTSASDLLRKVRAHQDTTGFNMRARVEVKAKGAQKPTVIQVRALGKSDGQSSRVLYQALWPDALKGQAVVVERTNPGEAAVAIGGFFYTPPDHTTPITPARAADSILGTDLSVEDLADTFMFWPDARFTGTDRVGSDDCRIIEVRPPAGAATSYALIRACVSESKLLVLRVEKLKAGGAVTKRFTVRRAIKGNDFVVTARTIDVENLERGSTTTIDATSGDRGIVTATADFSMAKLKSLGK